MVRPLLISLVLATAAACDCGGGVLVSSPDDPKPNQPNQPTQPTNPTNPTNPTQPMNPPGWCSSDCDCPNGEACTNIGGGELTSQACRPGMNTCDRPCTVTCGAGTICQMGVCVTAPCLDPSCMMTMMPPGGVTVTGTYRTEYELDVHEFSNKAMNIAKLLDVLGAALNGQSTACSQTSVQGQLICFAIQLVAANIMAPPWVGQLINVLAGMFRFGDTPVRAKGVMQLAEAQGGALSATETWSEMWLNYNGTQYNVMNGAMLGTNGQLTVTVRAFGGTRSFSEVNLGPRRVEFDVNKLLVNLINVAISAGSNNQAHDVGELLDLLLCSQIQITSPGNYLLCRTAAQQLADQFELDSGLGGIRISEQKGTIYDDDLDGKADGFGRATPVSARGSARGDMTNGITSGDLGAFPKSNWYGVRQ
ncbi:MAG: hypothetical protein JNK82_28880 [Myxococcaceae bacterium]|nr:hypothetical protein [Myxococcaceae bacterium]